MSSGFISESELAERRRIRQEEWEKVRQPNQPIEAPEEEYDPRSLFERLEEQKKKKQFEYEEAHRLKNMIKGIDDDEVEFLELVDKTKMEEERKKCAEEEIEIADFRNKVADLQEKSLEQRIQQEIRRPLQKTNNIKTGRSSQTKLLAGVVIRKRTLSSNNDNEVSVKKNKNELNEEDQHNKNKTTNNETMVNNGKENKVEDDVHSTPSENTDNEVINSSTTSGIQQEQHQIVVNDTRKLEGGNKTGGFTCIGILPGLGPYSVSSDDSECSTDVEEDADPASRYDLLGRKIKIKSKTTTDK